MGQTKTTITLNGKLYDATTGVILSDDPGVTVSKRKAKVVDGFYRAPQVATAKSSVPVAKTVSAPKAKTRPAVHRAASAAPVNGHKPAKSQTLMRHVVPKPNSSPVVVTPKAPPTAKKPLHDRELRAAHTTKSAAISRFNTAPVSKPTGLTTKIAPLAVRPHPHVQAVSKQVAAVATRHSTEDTFSRALQAANSHQQKSPVARKTKLRHRAGAKLGISARAVNVASVFVIIILLGAFITYQNAARISMNLATAKAGFLATMPGYTPSGFGLAGPIQASPGVVTVSFRSHSDSRSFTLTQKPSNWTSSSLLRSVVAVNKQQYQTIEDKGKTIYLYNDGQATWVTGGIWYQVSGNAQLGSEQLVHLADSL